MGIKAWFKKYRSPLSMLLVQLFVTGMLLLSKIVLNRGAFIFSLLTYRQIVAAVFLIPLAFIMERNMANKLSWKAAFWVFFNGLFGITMTISLYYYGIKDTSATFAANFLNLIPIATFVLSIACGMEKLGMGSRGGRVKIAGTILCVGGAIIITLYKGKSFHLWPSHMHIHHTTVASKTHKEYLHGSLKLVGSCLSSAAWFLAQVKLFKVFPSLYWATILTCLVGSLQSAIIGIALDRQMAAWKLRWDLQLLTIFYSGVLTTSANFCLITWTVACQGPTYPSMFNPVSLIFVTILESVFLGEEMSIGSILGMITTTAGLYAFLWGKRNQSSPHNVSVGDVSLAVESFQSNSLIAPDSHQNGSVAQKAQVKDNRSITVVTES